MLKRKLSKAYIIDPETQTITSREEYHIQSLIDEVVGDDAEPLQLDLYGNTVWVSDSDRNNRYAYYF